MIHGERTSEERRQSPRFPFIRFIQWDRGGGAFETVGAPIGEMDGAAINVSKEGVCLLIGKRLEKETVIKIGLPILGTYATTSTLAEVKWVRKTPWRDSCFAGCRFLI